MTADKMKMKLKIQVNQAFSKYKKNAIEITKAIFY